MGRQESSGLSAKVLVSIVFIFRTLDAEAGESKIWMLPDIETQSSAAR